MNIKKVVIKLLKEYVIQEKIKDDFEVLPTTKEEASPFVMKHYLEAWPAGIKRIYGIYKKVNTVRQMVGVIIYGVPFHTVGKFLEPEVNSTEILELKRLFIDDIGVKNLESFVIGQSLKLLKRDEPSIKVVVTFADDREGHKGTIYQATNAIYLGLGGVMKHKYIYILNGNINAIKNKIQMMVKQYPKKDIQENYLDIDGSKKELKVETYTYTDIGHNLMSKTDKVWFWKNNGEELIVLPSSKSHLSQNIRADFEGRYDSDKKTVSIIDMGSYRNHRGNTNIHTLPPNLVRRLKFEFGDNVRLQTFFEENIKETVTYNDIGHRPKSNNKIWWWYNDGEEFHTRPASGGSHPSLRSDFEGRYDADKNMISLVDMGEYRKAEKFNQFGSQFDIPNAEIRNVPENLLRRLKFEFGDNASIKTFFEENIKTISSGLLKPQSIL